MIGYINKIILVVLAGLGLLTIYNLSEAHVISVYLQEEGQKALDREDYTFFMPSRYYNEVLLEDFVFTEGSSSFHIRIYEVARIMAYQEGLKVEDGIFLLIEQLTGENLAYTLDVEFVSSDDLVISYLGKKQLELPLYATIQKQSERTILLKEDFYDEDSDTYFPLTNIRIYENKTLSYDLPVSIDFDTFLIKDQIISYMELHDDEAPKEGFLNVSIAPVIRPVDSNNVILRNMIIYVVFVVFMTFLIYGKRNKRLGRKKATEGLQVDVEKLKENDKKKR